MDIASSSIQAIKSSHEETRSIILAASKNAFTNAQRLPRLQKAIAITAVTFLTFSYIVFKKISTPPKKLSHIPAVNYVQMMKAYFTGEPLTDATKRVINPVIADSSKYLYLRPSRGLWNIYVTNPKLAKIVFNKTDLFPKLDLTDTNKNTFNGKFQVRSNNLFFSAGDEWKRQRRIANPAFQRSTPINLFGCYTERLFEVIGMVKGDRVQLDMNDFIRRLTLDILGSSGFDFDFNSLYDSRSEYVQRYDRLMNAVTDPLFFFFPDLDRRFLWAFPKRRQIHRELDMFLHIIREIIADRRSKVVEEDKERRRNERLVDDVISSGGSDNNSTRIQKDILLLLIESAYTDENNDVLTTASDDMLLSNMCILFTAGHDTTTSTLLSTLYELAVNPEIQEKARAEVIAILQDNDENTLPTEDQISQMTYIGMIIKEQFIKTLRLHPPVPVSGVRLTTEDCHLGETYVPKGSTVVVDIISVHRNPEYWKLPEQFDPDRFSPGGEAEKNLGLGSAWVPFGGGVRHCIGRAFALNQQYVVLAMLLKKYTWALPEDSIHKNGLVTKGIFLLSPIDMQLDLTSRY